MTFKALMAIIRRWISPILRWRRAASVKEARKEEPESVPARPADTSSKGKLANVYAAGLVPPPQARQPKPPKSQSSPPPQHGPNRAERRRLEAARRRHDVFVTPKGERPYREPCESTKPDHVIAPPISPEEPEPTAVKDPNDVIIVGEIDGDKVLVEEHELWGEFSFRDTILDQLEHYWYYLSRMRRYDPASYDFYKLLGATILPPFSNSQPDVEDIAKIEKKYTPEEIARIRADHYVGSWFRDNLPAFGCFAYGIDNRTDVAVQESEAKRKRKPLWRPKFMYFTRYELPPPNVQRVRTGDGAVYKMTVWWDRQHGHNKWGHPTEFAVHVNSKGSVCALRVLNYQNSFWRSWHYPEQFGFDGISPAENMINLFVHSSRHFEESNYSVVRVAVKNLTLDMTAVFGVNVRKLAYFFQDRDIELTEGGSRRRVFHMVRPHVRNDGAVVPMHFRGVKEFTWADYQVSITVPGRDHFSLAEVSIGAIDTARLRPEERKKQRFLTERQFGERLIGYMKAGVGSFGRRQHITRTAR